MATELVNSTVPIPVPTRTPQPNFGKLLIIDDVLYPKDSEPLTPLQLHVRLALFVVAQLVPIITSILITLSRKGWWRRKFFWTMNRFMVLWLVSIQVFGAVVYFQNGATTRILFITATIHLQIEYMILALLLKCSGLQALIIAYIGGTVLFSIQLFVSDFSIVYMLSTISGFTDFAFPLLALYGKQWWYATAGFAHFVQAVSVFCIVVKNFGIFWWDFITFWSTWIQNGAIAVAVFQAWLGSGTQNGTQPIALPSGDDESETDRIPGGEAPDNPLADVDVPKPILIGIFGVSIVGSIISSFIFVFVVARD